jgi:hypothetical protein
MRTVVIPRTLATLNLAKTIPQLIAQAKAMVAEIVANPTLFPSPNPSIAAINAQIAALEVSQTAALNRVHGAVEDRNVKARDLRGSLHMLRAYVESQANLDPGTAPATIRAAGILVRKVAVRTKLDFEVKQGAVSGTVILVAKAAGPRASYAWQWSLDEKVWTDLPPTLKARTSMVNLAVPVMHSFRYRALTKAGIADWSQVVSLLVK